MSFVRQNVCDRLRFMLWVGWEPLEVVDGGFCCLGLEEMGKYLFLASSQ